MFKACSCATDNKFSVSRFKFPFLSHIVYILIIIIIIIIIIVIIIVVIIIIVINLKIINNYS